MSEWLKQNIAMTTISTLMVIIMSIIGFSGRAMIKEMDKKATKAELEASFLLHEKETALQNQMIIANAEEIQEVKEEAKETQALVLWEIRELRKDLKLKEDKP